MSDSLTLLTSDDPPVSLTASRTALAANSKVFADMLSVPAGGKASEPVVVAEAQEALEPFLRLLEGQAPKLSSPQWEVLARLGDKYDSFVVQQAVDARGWKLESKDEEPLHAFTLATTTGNKALLDRSTLRAIRVADRSTLGADKEWGDRLPGA
ncbi:uncharacterized protein RHOBADRAFT_41366 [Rhodotorula graminis WP1]|uniref:BTB domain-containing protein n=1 Tax=Rhodotorula graminis (strain WP1) TaxID=578459 RepID=A0A194S9G6_RHOGW|nr:uncharacterized protein RHOBADRAFT_41366 [Rhodotorula graminis WP1]KPV77373.1 hypothetical protein RHOBADRAFT_41366 [Rhodotorula graminis WP1]